MEENWRSSLDYRFQPLVWGRVLLRAPGTGRSMLPASISLDTYLPNIEGTESRVITFLRRLNVVELLSLPWELCLWSFVLFCFVLRCGWWMLPEQTDCCALNSNKKKAICYCSLWIKSEYFLRLFTSVSSIDQLHVSHLNARQHSFIFTHLKTWSSYLLVLNHLRPICKQYSNSPACSKN